NHNVKFDQIFTLNTWLLDVNETLGMKAKTYFLGTVILNRVFSVIGDIEVDQLQGYAIACLYIASCMLDDPPHLEYTRDPFSICSYITDHAYTSAQIKDFYAESVKRLDGQLYCPTAYSFTSLLRPDNLDIVNKILVLASFNKGYYEYTPYDVAASAIYIVNGSTEKD